MTICAKAFRKQSIRRCIGVLVVLLLVTLTAFALADVKISARKFPDEHFREYVSKTFDLDGDGLLSRDEIAAAKGIYVESHYIVSLQGIEVFTSLESLYCGSNRISGLDLSRNTKLQVLDCSENDLATLDISKNKSLTMLTCNDNRLMWLNVGENTNLQTLECSDNHVSVLDLSRNSQLKQLVCSRNNLTKLDVTGCPELVHLIETVSPKTQSEIGYGWWNDDGSGWPVCDKAYLFVDNSVDVTPASSKDIVINAASFPDKKFRSYVKKNFDTDSNGMLNSSEIEAVTRIDVAKKSVSSLKGIEVFPALKQLNCEDNSLTALDVSMNTKLTYLNCSGNMLTELNVTGNTALKELIMSNNKVKALDLSRNAKLKKLICSENQLTSLDLHNNTALVSLNCMQNRLKTLDVSSNTVLEQLWCSKNKLTSLDVRKCKTLARLVKSSARSSYGYFGSGWWTDNGAGSIDSSKPYLIADKKVQVLPAGK